MQYVDEIDAESIGHILIRFKNGDIVFSSYVTPQDSPYHDPMDFCNIANAFVPIDNPKIVLGGGDLNGRIGDLARTVSPSNGSYRDNCDEVVNDHGKEIINICQTFSCYVLNNLNIRW